MFTNSKRRFSILLTLALVLSFILGSISNIAYADSSKKITIVHVNDVHGRVKEDEREGAIGYSKLKTYLDSLKEKNPNTLLLNAGDTLHGTTLVNVTEGKTMVELMNKVGFDAMTPGNHDFNYGYERLVELKDMANFPFITANVVREKDGKSDFKPYIVKEIDGVKVGIFGLTTEETVFKSHPDNTKGVKFINPIKAAKDSVKALKDEKADIIIALGHIGVEGTTLTDTKEILKEVKGIDIFIDGHSHEETNEKVGDTLLVQAGEYTKNLGLIDIEYDKGIKSIKTDLFKYEEAKKLKENEEINKEIEKIDEINKPILDVVVGETKVELDGVRGNVRTKETNLGNLVADSMLAATEADIAFTNGGGIRAPIKKGTVRVGDIITTVPFTNTLAVIEASGEEILKALERGVDSYPEEAGHFPQLAGINFSFDPNAEVGKRVVSVSINGEELDKNKTYKVVTNDFIAAGGDGYTMFEGKPFVAEGGLLSDVLIEHFKNVKTVEPKVEGRIKIAHKQIEDLSEAKNSLNLKINGKLITIPENFGKIYIKDSRTLVPVRFVSEKLGHKVKWDGKNRVVTIDDRIKLKEGEKIIEVDGKKLEMDSALTINNSRSYLPLRFVSEALGYEVKWDKDTRTVDILIKDEIKPAA